MSDDMDAAHDLEWYQDRWAELMEILSLSNPEEVLTQVRSLQISALKEAKVLESTGLADGDKADQLLRRLFRRLQELRRENQVVQRLKGVVEVASTSEIVDAVKRLRARLDELEAQHESLTEAGFKNVDQLLRAFESMEQQLNELYGEKEATERVNLHAETRTDEADTFDQLQALLAREEKLQRELGVSSADAVLEMVENLTEQLETLYRYRDADADTEPTRWTTDPSLERRLTEQLGVSDPEAVITMVQDLSAQLDDLYGEKERFAELDLNGAESAAAMVENMQEQLESLYGQQKELSERGIHGVEHALSMIENMEEQLRVLYEERQQSSQGTPPAEDSPNQHDELREQLHTLADEKEALRRKRDALQDKLDALHRTVGTDDPDTIFRLIQSMEEQLDELYEEREAPTDRAPLSEDDALISASALDRLDSMTDDELNAVSAGVLCVDDHGTVQRANRAALHWPDATAEEPSALEGMNFFKDVAPGTNNSLFRGRIEEGIEEGALDEKFSYTYVSEYASPTNLSVHLYRDPDQTVTWILFRML